MGALDRRTILKYLLALFACGIARRSCAAEHPQEFALPSTAGDVSVSGSGAASEPANFKTVYSDPALRDQFYLFLQNIFHLYPEDRFHRLITEISSQSNSDREIYEKLQERLPEIKPRLSVLTYALPALAKQKKEMARQTAELLGSHQAVRGYVEIGTLGRYVNGLRKRVKIDGLIFVVNDRAATLSLEDIAERGQLTQIGQYVPLGNYDALEAARVADASVDLVTNFIGFHHAPAERLDPFVASICRVLKPGGRLVVRDHDVDNPEMHALVALAHDVFNAGLNLPWTQNQAQVRNFTSSKQLEHYLAKMGFERSGGMRLQQKDPTKNTLMMFSKRA